MDVLVSSVSVRLHGSRGVSEMESRYLASGATKDEGQKWGWPGALREGAKLSGKHRII